MSTQRSHCQCATVNSPQIVYIAEAILEALDLWTALFRLREQVHRPGRKILSMSMSDMTSMPVFVEPTCQSW